MPCSSHHSPTTASLPIDGKEFESLLKEKIAESTVVKKDVQLPTFQLDEFRKSFQR
jgi:hypothetical protein